MRYDYNFVKDNNVLSDADKDRIVCIVLNATIAGADLPIDWDTAATAFGSKSAKSFKQSFTDSLKKITKAGGGSHEPGTQAATMATTATGDGDGATPEPVTPAKKKAAPRKRKTKADGEGAEEEPVTPAKKKATPRKKKGETAVKSEIKAEGEGEEDVM
ncbi:hypothetical protein W97_02337 [Coniosporium apollinis CBS 100218]|uniref:Uncharacterized protein n=1 Tax=Coniosporium apollinis (strain CBS 100218) TaxID=1168221 RepID=R7YMH5_CONA1|nr:uncharacterized protein W97_02337 [Coniosporium apollinis CBS 100218]EON63110.1 hypothetical protein W97_02337 [Coniosporium apollinis CBS 100218]